MRGEQNKSCIDRKDNVTIGFRLKTDWSVCYGPNCNTISTAFIWERIYVIQLFEAVTTFLYWKWSVIVISDLSEWMTNNHILVKPELLYSLFLPCYQCYFSSSLDKNSIFPSSEAPSIILREWFWIQFVFILMGYITCILYNARNLRVHIENKTFIIFWGISKEWITMINWIGH